jgi:CheY-like chemotaxis protein
MLAPVVIRGEFGGFIVGVLSLDQLQEQLDKSHSDNAMLYTLLFDLVLMDIQIPIMNGEEALKEIRLQEQGTSRHQPVIALTSYSMRGDKERFLQEGFDGYVSKPFDIMELICEMMRVIGIAATPMKQE